jgi:transposase
MRPQGTTRQLEKRRRRAIRLWKRGKPLSAVARKLRASRSSIWRWVHTYRQQGLRGLRPKPTPGRPSYLSRTEKEQLAQMLLQGARAIGYRTELWTLGRIAKVIWRHFRVRYHPHAVWYLLRTMGWSCQKPTRRAQQRDEAAIARWRRYVWPHIKKGCPARGASGFPGRKWLFAYP